MATLLVAPKPFYEIQGDMAASEQQQQQVEMNQMKIEQAKQQMADEQARRADMQKAYQMSQQDQQQGPGQAPQTDITQLATQKTQPTIDSTQAQDTQVKAPDGTPMPSFMTGAKTEADSKTPAEDNTPIGYKQQAQPDTSKTGQDNVLQNLKDTKKNIDTQDQAIAINNKAIQLAYQRGDAAYAKTLLEENNDLKLKRADAELKHLQSADKSMEVMGKIGNFYKGAYDQFLTDNPNATPEQKQQISDKLWTETITRSQMVGIPADNLIKAVTPDQRNQIASGLVEGSEKGSDITRVKIAELKDATTRELGKQKLDLQQQRTQAYVNFTNAKTQGLDAKQQAAAGELALKYAGKERDKLYELAKTGDENAIKAIPVLDAQIAKLEKEVGDIYKTNKLTPQDVAKVKVDNISSSSTKADQPPVLPVEQEKSMAQAQIDKINSSNATPEAKQNAIKQVQDMFAQRHPGESLSIDTPPSAEDKKAMISNVENQIKTITRRLDSKGTEKADVASESKKEMAAWKGVGSGIKDFITGEGRRKEDLKKLEELKAILEELKKQG